MTAEHVLNSQSPSRPRVPLAVRIGVGVLAGFAILGVLNHFTGRANYHEMSCSQLRAETLSMTGANATKPYDIDRVREIGNAAHDKGCLYLNPLF